MTKANHYGELPYAGKPHRWLGCGGRKIAILAAILVAMVTAEGAGDVFLLPASNILWRTAPSATFKVPVFMPAGASSATLVVTGHRYRQEYTGLDDGMFQLSLPAADSVETENVYNLALTFNDALATTHHASLAVVRGSSPGGVADVDVRVAGSHKWPNVATKAVLAIPSGVDAISINGETVSEHLWQSPGWYLLLAQSGKAYDVLLSSGGLSLDETTLHGVLSGFTLVLR